MRKIREALRLRFGHGLSIRETARSLGMSHSTAGELFSRANSAGISWPLDQELDDLALEAALYPPAEPAGNPRPEPDVEWIHRELKRKGVTLQLLWLEHKRQYPDGLQLTQFCERYRRWRRGLDLVLRQSYVPGEKLFVDFAGQTVPIIDAQTGEARQAQIFVAVLGASNYTYAEACRSQEIENWVGANIRAFEYFGGTPQIIVPDNLKSGIHQADRYEPDINPTYHEMAAHYGAVIIPARRRKPRDKAKVESGVRVVESWILAALRNRRFFSEAELNAAISTALTELNNQSFQKLPGCRRFLFESTDKPALKPLPKQRYEVGLWARRLADQSYHVFAEGNYYSVPYTLAGKEVEIRLTAGAVELFNHGRRVASHGRKYGAHPPVTNPLHRSPAHQKYLEWTPERLGAWAQTMGPATQELFSQIMATRRHIEQASRSCLGIVRLQPEYGPERIEAAALRAVAVGATSYKSIKAILQHNLDQIPVAVSAVPGLGHHDNVRGPAYYAAREVASC
jgi:transposase